MKETSGIKFYRHDPKDAISVCLCLDVISMDVLSKTMISAGQIRELDEIKKRHSCYQAMMNQMDDEQLMEFYKMCLQDFDWILRELEARLGKEIKINLPLNEIN